jgi:hypothetical protein
VIGDFALQENEFMAAMAGNLTLAEFETRYGKGDQAFEYWRGQAIPKGMPTWIHGIIQRIVMELLTEAGYNALEITDFLMTASVAKLWERLDLVVRS